MTPTLDPVLVKRLSIFASASALVSGLIGLSVLAGWTLRIPVLLTWGLWTPMAPNAAGCALLAALSLWLRRQDFAPAAGARRRSAEAAAALVIVTGALSLGEHLFHSDFGIDRLLLFASPARENFHARILMSPVAAWFFVLFGAALLAIDWRRRRKDWPAQFLVLGAAIGVAFGLLGLILGPDVSSITVALPAEASYFLLVCGLVSSRSRWAFGGLLVGQSSGARLLRRAVPGALLVLGLIGWLISKPLLTDTHFTRVQVSALAVFCSTLLAGFIAWVAFQLERGEAKRREVESTSNLKEEQLERLLGRAQVPESEKQLRRQVKAGFGVAIFLTTLLGFLSWHNSQQATEDADQVAHTHEVLTMLEATLRHLVDVETGARGFAMTGDEPFLEPYEKGEAAVEQDLKTLRRLTADNPGQQQRLDLLQKQADARIKAGLDLVILRERTREVPTEAHLEPGKRLTDEARATVAQMETVEEHLLQRRNVQARAARQFSANIIALGSFLGAVFLAIAGAAVNREVAIGARARAQVNSLNAELERRVAQRTAALGESEGRLAGVIQSAMDAILTVDEQQNIVMFNAAAEKMFRCTGAEALGQPITRFIPQRFHSAHAGHIQRFGDTGVTSRAMGSKDALWAARADGQEFQIEASISQVVTGGKKLFTVILRDVTERVQAEQSLREAQARMTGIIASAMDAIITTDDEQHILVFNEAAEKVFRCTAAEALGQSITRFIPQRFHGAHGGHMKEFAEKGVTARAMGTLGALWGVRADGEEFRIEASISHISAAGRNLFTVILRDITERVRVEALREHMAAVVDFSDDAIISKDLQGIISAWNRGAEKVFGYTAAEAVGKHMLMLFPPERVSEEADILGRVGWGESVEHFETVRVRKDGRKIDVSVTISPIRDPTGRIVGASKIARDITGRKQVERTLRKSEENYRTLWNSMDEGFCTIEVLFNEANEAEDYRFLEVNPAFEKHAGIVDGVGKRMREIAPQHEDSWFQIYGKIALTGEPARFENFVGELGRWFDVYAFRVGDPDERRVAALFNDITERKRTEAALREQAQIMDSAQVFVRDMQGRVVYWPKGAEKLYGFSRQEAVGIVSHDLFHTKFPEPLEVVEKKLFEMGMWEGELIHTRRDGSVVVVSSTWVLHRDSQGQPIRILETNIDITARKKAEDALRESETNFAAVVNLAPQFVWICTNEGLNTYFNDRWYRYTGLTPEQSLGKGWNTPFHPDDKQAAWDAWNQATATGGTYSVESRLQAADGSYRWFLMRGEPVRDNAGGIVKWFGTCTDIDDMKKARDAMRESEDRFRLFVEHAPAALAMFDREMHYLHWSRRWQTDYGLESRDLRGVSHYEIFPEIPERWKEIHRRGLAGEVLRGEDDRFDRIDGSTQWIRWEVRPWYDRTGVIAGIVIFAEEITARKQAEKALRDSEERFQAMANGIPQLAWMAEADGNIFWYNQRWYEYTGTTFEQMQGWGWESVHDPTVLPEVTERWKAAIAAGTPFEMEFPLRRADGRFGTFLTRIRPLRDADGRVVRWFGTNTDISDLKLAERRLEGQAEELSRQAIELARSRQALEIQTLMLQSVLDSMQEGLVAADETGRFILWNPAATRIVGMGAEDVPPAEWHTHYGVYLPDAVTAFPIEQNPLTRALRGEVSTAEMFVRNPALEHGVWIEISGSPLKSADGSLRGGVVAFRDISQRKNDEREIRQLNEELEEKVLQRTAELATANHELEAFAYSVSHDLRAPLRHIGGFSKILIEDFGPTLAPEAVRHLERIEEGTRRMGQLVDELLNLARVGRHALKLQSTPLNALIEEVISLLQPEVQGRVVTWKVAELPAVECDPILMKQVFQNLIANALKFTRPRERAVIEIGIEPVGGQAAVFVRDNGVGFNMKYSDKLFGVFQRLHRIEDFEGTGVGLATVQRIVHKHGGRVWAEAELDKGAAFFLTLEPVKGSHLKAEDVLRSEAKALNAKEPGSKAAAAAGDGE